MRRCVWSRNLVNEEALAHWGLWRQKKKKEHSVRIHGVGWQVRYSNWCLLCQNLTVRNEHLKKRHTGFRNGTLGFGRPRRWKITSWIRLFLRKLRVPHLVNKFLTRYESRNIITMLTYLNPYPEQDVYSPCRLTWFLSNPFFIVAEVRLALQAVMRATFPAHFIRLDFITRTIFDKEWKSRSFSLGNFFHTLDTSYFFCLNIFFNTPSARFLLWEAKIRNPIKIDKFKFFTF